jgi:putative hemolysin
MNADDIPSLILIFVLLLFSALFSSSETSLFSLDVLKLRKLKGRKGTKRIRQLLREGSLLLVAILLGNTTVNVALSSLTEQTLRIDNYVYSTIIVASMLLFFGEISPKTIAISRVENTALFTSKFLYPIFLILKPIAKPIEKLSDFLLRAVNKIFAGSGNSEVAENHLTALLSMVSRGSFLEADQKKLVESVLKFTSLEVENIMTPRTKVVSIDKKTPLNEVIDIFQATKFSKIPVFSGTNDNIVGVVYLRDVFYYIYNPGKIGRKTAGNIMETMYFVPQTKKLSEMLEDFQCKQIRIAAVVDEYGSSIGIVTVADVLGEIVGEIVDESFDIKKKIVRVTKNRYIAAGDINLDDFNEFFDTKISSDEFDTLAGFVIDQAGDIPDIDYTCDIGKYIITVRDRSSKRIDKFLVEKK